MSRQPTKEVSLRFVLSTLRRLQFMSRLDAETLAETLKPYLGKSRRFNVAWLADWLSDVAEFIGPEPCPKCAECAREIRRDSYAARYCSTRCKQRAYRKRKCVTVQSRGIKSEV